MIRINEMESFVIIEHGLIMLFFAAQSYKKVCEEKRKSNTHFCIHTV
jgi:hypothetical protein